jgi:N-acetyl-anhydromuramyl-L-alanine amidase AmpD
MAFPFHGSAQPEQNLVPVFESAAREFSVPASLLKGIAFVETRWMHVRPETSFDSDRHMPPAYGVMGLRDDEWFGHSLIGAARLINEQPATLRDDIVANIRGAAALLARLASQERVMPTSDDLLRWFDVIAKYPGIPQKDLQGSYAEHVFRTLYDGYNQYGIEIEPHEIDLNKVEAIRLRDYASGQTFSPASEDYGPAVWDASPNFSSRAGSPITHVIVHDTEGSFDGSVSWLKNPASQASAHYIFRSVDGFLKQLVREADKAWHVVCWNPWTIGIEHEGYVNNPAWFTPIMYQQSALLVRHLTNRYGISRNRLKIVGHNVWQSSVIFPQLGWDNCNNHTDPGPFWNWDYYLSLIVSDSTPPAITSFTPTANQQNVPVYKSITIKFDRPMDIFSTQAAFSLFPGAPGAFRWSADAKTMTYDPTSNLTAGEAYLVSVAATAKSAGGGPLQQALQYTFATSALDTVGPRIVRSYPVHGSTNISPGTAFQIRFDEPVVYSTFAGRVRLVDVADSSQFIGVGNVTYVDIDDKGLLTFAPAADLQLGHTYRLRFLPGLRDPLNNQTTFESRIEFTIQTTVIAQGIVIDPFENNAGQWQQPQRNPGTIKIDSTQTSFSIATTFRRNGAYSGKLAYTFSDTIGGVCRLMTLAPIPVSTQNGWLGIWMFGDNSSNQLEYWFTNTSGSNQIVPLGTINWFGWKFVLTPVVASMSSFNSVVVRQTNGADISGNLYFDDLQTQLATGVTLNDGAFHKSFALYQNYPNPFNPSTTITFELERPEQAHLVVFNSLGQQVALLVNKRLEAGRHRIEFSGRGSEGKYLPSGVYMYRLQTSAGVEVKKMLLLK